MPTAAPPRTPHAGRRGAGRRLEVAPEARLDQPARESLVLAAVAAGAAVVVWLWWRDNPAGSVHGLASWFTAAGRLTGLLGGYLCLVEVALMARIPWVDDLIGTDRLGLWHRRNGEYSLGLLLAHAVLVVWGYGLADRRGPVAETRAVLGYPDMLTATAGLAILAGVGVLSTRALRGRLDYQIWYALHLGTYVALALGFSHQLATGADFVGRPLNRFVWVAMYAFVAALVLGYRVGVPTRDALRHRLRVAGVVREAPGVVSIYVTGERLDEMTAEAGQFFNWRFLARGCWWQSHPFSLSAAPNPRFLRITVKDLGDHTGDLQRLRPGTRVVAEGPHGAFTGRRRTRRRVLLVGGGVGITPLRALFEALPAAPGELTLLYRASSPADLVFRDELDQLAARRGARVLYAVGARDRRPDPLSARALRSAVPHLADHDVYVCGPPGMTAAAVSGLRAAGVPRARIHTEEFER